MKKLIVIALLLICSSAFAEIDLQSSMTNSEFKSLVSDLGMIVTPTLDSPAEPLGITGFDIAVEGQLTDIDQNSNHWKHAVSDSDPSGMVGATRIHVQKGLPFGVDLGASVTTGSNVGFTAVTLEGKYAILEGSVITPAISTRLAYTHVSGMNDIKMQTGLAGIYISKGILMLTPYAGFEDIYTVASENSDKVNLRDVDKNNVRGLVGLQVSPFPFMVINGEVARTGEVYQYSAKVGIRF